jgi:DNA-binding winged helix-turn-helix (wHTH) protein/TolB-like protein/lipoprotein NlpI
MNRFYEFGSFSIDAEKRVLMRDGEVVPLAPKAFDTLLVLVEHHGQVLEKDELMKMLWPDSEVEESNLSLHISALRKAMGDSPTERRYIITVPGRGYKFTTDVRKADDDRSDVIVARYRKSTLVVQDQEQGQELEQKPKGLLPVFVSPKRNLALILLAGIGIAGLGFAVYYLWRVSLVSTAPTSSKLIATTPPVRSIAVLPFKPLVADQRDESLEMGMADTLIARLSNLREINVRPISSVHKYAALGQDAVAAGREQQVDVVVEGHMQKSGEKIRVTVRLVKVADGTQLWAGQFDEKFADVFTVQDLISEKVVSALALKLTGEEQKQLTKHYTEDAEAYQLYINGRFFWDKETEEGIKKAIEYFEKAIERDPNYAMAHAGLADSYSLLAIFGISPPKEAFPKAQAAVLKALEIDDRLAEAHAALGHIKVQYEYDWSGGEREYQRAIELKPNYATVHLFYAHYLGKMGRFDEGIAEIKRAQELEPLSLIINSHVGVILYYARQYDQAINQLKRTLEINPNLDHPRSLLGRAYLKTGMYEQAIAEFQRRTTVTPGSHADLGYAYALSGRREEALREVEKLQGLSKRRYVPSYDLALIYAGLDDKDQAFAWLDKAYEDRSQVFPWLKVDPRLDNLRSDPRFKAVIKRMRLE